LITHPYVGSIWLTECEFEEGFVGGKAWNDSMSGSPYYPDDYTGEWEWMWFPVGCIKKLEGN
jgi:hypothetical protein